eukprot:403348898
MRAKYFMSLQLYEKTKDVLLQISKNSDVMSLRKIYKHIEWLDVLNMALKSEQIENLQKKYQEETAIKILGGTDNHQFVSLKVILLKNIVLNRHHTCNLQQLKSKNLTQIYTQMNELFKQDLDILDPTGTELFISLIFSTHQQFLKHCQYDSDSDQLLETYSFMRDMWKNQSEQLSDNNKFMDMIFDCIQLLIQSISQSPILILQLIDESINFLSEISIPFQLSQSKLNKMSLYKIISALYFLVIQVNQMGNKQGAAALSNFYLFLLTQIQKYDKVQDGTVDFMELFEKILKMFEEKHIIQDLEKRNLKELVELINDTSKIIAGQLFHGEYYNYQNKLLLTQKQQILSLLTITNSNEIEQQDLQQMYHKLARETVEFSKRSISYYSNSANTNLIVEQANLAFDAKHHDEVVFFNKELVDFSLKTKNYRLFIQKALDFLDFLQKQLIFQECKEYAEYLLDLFEKSDHLKMIIQGYNLQISFEAI